MCQVFTVDDLKYLRHTGRLSAIKTIIGTVLGIKPLLKGDTEGKIVCFARTRGRKLSIRELAAQYAEHVVSPETQTIGIAHADCPEDTAFLKSLIEKTLPPREIMTVFYEPVTGSHVGPGTLALFFDGDAGFRGKLPQRVQISSGQLLVDADLDVGAVQRRYSDAHIHLAARNSALDIILQLFLEKAVCTRYP